MKRITVVIFAILICFVGLVRASKMPPDITLLWNKFIQLKTIGQFVIGLSQDGIVGFAMDNSANNLIESNHLVLSSDTKSMRQQGNLLVVRRVDDKLSIIDISQLPELNLLSEITPEFEYSDFVLKDDYLYLSRWFEGIDKFRVSNFQELDFIANIKPGVVLTQLDYDIDYLYALDKYNGIVRIPLNQQFGQAIDTLLIPERPFSFSKLNSMFSVSLNTDGAILAVFDQGNGQLIQPIIGFPSPAQTFMYGTKLLFVSPRRIDIWNGLGLTIDKTIPMESQLTNGDTITFNNEFYLLLPNIENGITAFCISDGQEPSELLTHPGLIDAVLSNDNVLFTGGRGNPLEMYRIDSDSLTAPQIVEESDNGCLDLLTLRDTLFVLHNNDFVVFDISDIDGIVNRLDSVPHTINNPHMLNNSDDLIMIIGRDQIELFENTNGNFESVALWPFASPIADVMAHDNKLYITDRLGRIAAYDITQDFTLTQCDNRDLTGTGWAMESYQSKLGIFSGRILTLFEGCLDVDTIVQLSLAVMDAEIKDDTLFTIGADGLVKYDITSGVPVYVQSEELSGSKISVGKNFIATTNGTSINLYFRNNSVQNEHNRLQSQIVLHNNFPEPFNSSTVIQYEIPNAQHVTLTLYNMLGQQVKNLVNANLQLGQYTVRWDGRDNNGNESATGVYFYKLQTADEVVTKKMMLIR